MTSTIKKSLSSFLAVCMLFGLFFVLDQPITANAAEALSNVSTISTTSVQKGQSVQVNAMAKGGTGFYQYAAYSKLSSATAWTTEQGYGANSIIMVAFDSAGSYDVRVAVKDSNGEVATKDFVVSVGSSSLTNNSTLSATSIALGDSVKVNAKASGGTAPYLYGVYYKKTSSENWSTAQSYQSNTNVSFKPGSATTYDVKVKVKDASGKIVPKSFTVTVKNSFTNTSTISAESIALGKTVTINCSAKGGTTPYVYGVYYKLTTASSYSTVQAYNSNKTVIYTPQKAGTYDIKTKVKDVSGKIVSKEFKLTVTGSAVMTNTSSISAADLPLGDTLSVRASASGGKSPYQYAVYYRSTDTTTWKTVQNYSNNAVVTIKPTIAGEYEVCIKAKDSSGTIAKKYITFTAKSVLTNTSSISSEKIKPSESVTIRGSAKGGTGFYQYAFYYKKSSDSSWITKQSYSTTTTAKLKLSEEGTYDIYVKVKDSDGTIAKKTMKLTVAEEHSGTKYDITYYVDLNDSYLQKLNIVNDNPTYYYSGDGLELQDLMVEGYEFVGWFTAQSGGKLVTEIEKGTTGKKTLYAHWELVQYKITFDSPDVPVDSIYYTVDTGATLKKPSIGGYTFVGWSMDGKIVRTIPKGTTGNLTLHANWTSNRNQAEAVDKLDVPEVIEDYETGTILFVFEIGTIHNVPLSRIDVGENTIIGPSDGLNLSKTYRYSTMVDEGFAKTVASAVSNATTKSSEWTLSEDWNNSTQATNAHEEELSKTKEVTDEYGVVTGSKYYISNSEGGSTSSTISGGGSKSLAAKITTDDSVGINSSYTHETEMGVSEKLTVSGKYHQEQEFKPEIGIGDGDFSLSLGGIGVSSGFEIGGSSETESYRKDKDSSTLAMSRNSSIGTEKSASSEAHWDASKTATSNWNTETGYEKSKTVSQSQAVSQAISDTIYNRWEYSSMESRGGSNSSTQSTGSSQELKDEYASTVEYSVETKEEKETKQEITRSEYGYYRLVNAGTAHVFAVVGYDIATNSYFTYTYNVLDKERHPFLDFSMKNALFNDCENAIIPFEIPIIVNEYVNSIMSGTDGLSINEDGYISGQYEGDAEYVVIPEYFSIKNSNKTYSAVRVHGFTSDVFRNNKTIKGIYLPKYVSEIPNNAFEGCTSLKTVEGFGITSIGSNAFKGCTSLSSFVIDEHVDHLGNNAFEGVESIDVTAANTNVADAAIASGAKRISLDLSVMKNSSDNPFSNKALTITDKTEFFHIMSNNATYTNISIKSDAAETRISNMVFKNNAKSPLDISSSKVLLGQVKVEDCAGLALILRADNTTLDLFGNIDLNSNADYTAISKNVILVKNDPKLTSLLKVNGIYAICGEMVNSDLFSGTIKKISETEFDAILTSCKVTFNPNGGKVSVSSQQVYYGQAYGTLPTPTRSNYSFKGWYTAASGGTKVTNATTVTALADHTLYAHWTPKKYTVYFNANGGTVNTPSKKVTYKSTYGELPSAQRDYYTFDGWYTAASGGTRLYDSTVFTGSSDITLYAHWNQHDVSGWVRESEVPYGAQIIETKWEYTLTEYTTSDDPSLPGWILYDSKTSWSDYGNWSGWSANYVANSDSRQVESRSVVASYTIKGYCCGNSSGIRCYLKYLQPGYTLRLEYPERVISKSDFANWTAYGEGSWFSYAANVQGYIIGPGTGYEDPDEHVIYFITNTNYETQYRYRERHKITTYYYKKTTAKTASYDPTGQPDVSDVVKYVKYRAK